MDALRGHGRMQLSLVALEGTALVGHIAFSPVTITQPDGAVVDGFRIRWRRSPVQALEVPPRLVPNRRDGNADQ